MGLPDCYQGEFNARMLQLVHEGGGILYRLQSDIDGKPIPLTPKGMDTLTVEFHWDYTNINEKFHAKLKEAEERLNKRKMIAGELEQFLLNSS